MELIYPETDKLNTAEPVMAIIREWMAWAEDEGAVERYKPLDQLLYAFFDIDKKALEEERRAMLGKLAKVVGGKDGRRTANDA